jgi:amino acid transporter
MSQQTQSYPVLASEQLKKTKMSTFTVVFMVFSLVAAGAYGIEAMIPSSGPGLTLIMLIVLPFVWGLPFGLVASELGSARPQEGGYYKWVQEALGEFWGFQAGWWRTISIYAEQTLYVVLAGGYLAGMLHFDKIEGSLGPVSYSYLAEFGFKFLMIVIFVFINLKGVKDVGVVTNILSILVLVAFASVAVVGFMNWSGNPFTTPEIIDEEVVAGSLTPWPVASGLEWVFYLSGGISVGMWMYSGYESMSTLAGELEDPQVIPKATLITVPLIMATYILPTMAGLAAFKDDPEHSFLTWGEDAGSTGYATVMENFAGPAFGVIFAIVAILAQCSIYNTYIASGSRGFFALADDRLAPKLFTKIGKKSGLPTNAVLSVGIVNVIICMIDFQKIVVVDVFLLVASYIMVYISAMILRKRIPDEQYRFKIPGGYKFLCVICIVPICIAFFSFLINGTDYFIFGMIGIITGPIMYFVWKLMYKGLHAVDPEKNPLNKKTRLAPRDLYRMACMFLILGVIGIIGRIWLPFYEGGQNLLGIPGLGAPDMAWDPENDYDWLIGSQEAMWNGILIAAIVCFVIAVALYFVGKKTEEPKK